MQLDKTANIAEIIIESSRLAHVIVLALKQEGLSLACSAAKAFEIGGIH
jgi:predicted phosphoribosyltransferase